MEYWINLNSVLAAADDEETCAQLAARLRDESVTLAIWTLMPEQISLAREIAASGIDLALIVPNLSAYVRDVTGGGPIKAMFTRFRQLPARAKASLLIHNSKHALNIIKQDFSMGLSILAEMELRRCTRLRLRRAVISSAVIDLAVALNNRQVVVRLLDLVQSHFGLLPLIETANLGITASKLVDWGIDTSELSYLSPLNKLGHGMRPDQALCEVVCRSGRVTVTGSDIDADGELPLDEAISYVQSLGVQACIVPTSVISKKGEVRAGSRQ